MKEQKNSSETTAEVQDINASTTPAHTEGDPSTTPPSNVDSPQPDGELAVQMQQLQQQLSEMTYARDYYYYQMVEKQNLLQNMVKAL